MWRRRVGGSDGANVLEFWSWTDSEVLRMCHGRHFYPAKALKLTGNY